MYPEVNRITFYCPVLSTLVKPGGKEERGSIYNGIPGLKLRSTCTPLRHEVLLVRGMSAYQNRA